MKRRFGAVLCLALGAVLLTSGLTDSGGVSVGVANTCGAFTVGATFANDCPTGTITITETTAIVTGKVAGVHAAATPTPPAGGWKVLVTSTCIDPNTGTAASQTATVPNNGTASTGPLYVFTSYQGTTPCSYALSQTNTPKGFTAAFVPTSPVTIPFTAGSPKASNLAVKLGNTAQAAPVSPSPSVVTTTPVPPTVVTETPAPSASVSGSLVHESVSVAPSSTAPIAATGPRRPIGVTVYLGIALLLLGAALLVGGLPRRAARHRD